MVRPALLQPIATLRLPFTHPCTPAQCGAAHQPGDFHLFRLLAILPFCLFRLFSLLSLFSLLGLSDLNAQICQDASVEVSAVVQSNPPRITLNWVPNAGATQHLIYRKLKSNVAWGNIVGSTDGTATQFVDSTATVGASYEYRIQRQAPNFTGYGYINSGIEIPAVDSRGKIILVIDESFKDSLFIEIERLQSDFEGDGWDVLPVYVSRTATVNAVKALIVEKYNLDKVNTRAAFLLGRVPVPYSGDINPDGHPDHLGAWPADVFYADMNGNWTDINVNDAVATDVRNRNTPKDGKFDQSLIPSDVELQIGRVDFANMPSFAASEQQLLKNYLDKDHAYRHKLFTAVHRGVVDDNFGYFGGEAFASTGWKNMGPLVGPGKVEANDYFLTTIDSSYQWVYGCGGGWFQGAGGIGSTTDFANSNLKGVFSMLFGSYFGDWDSQDNFLRAPLAQGLTLTNAWSGRPHWMFHHMGLGENIGYSTRISQNNSNLYFASYGARFVHIALMGDPTLRNDVVAPVSDVVVSKSGYDVNINWTGSPDSVLGYNVYVKSVLNPISIRLNEEIITGITYARPCFVDLGQEGFYTYMVRAVVLEHSPSGTYYNLSQGMTDTLTSSYSSPFVQADAAWVINGNEVAFTNSSLNASSYDWTFGDGQTSTEANPVHTYLDGYFTATLVASNDCYADTFYFDLNIFTGVKDITDDPSIMLAPNPSTGKFVLSWDDPVTTVGIKVYALAGNAVFQNDAVSNHGGLDLSALPAGIYVMHIVKDGERSMRRIVIQ